MHKSILTIILTTVAFSVFADSQGHNSSFTPFELRERRQLEDMALTSEGQVLAQQMVEAIEGGSNADKVQFAEDISLFTKDHDNPIAVLIALDNVNANNSPLSTASALDQLIEDGWINLDEDQKAYYENYQASKTNRRAKYQDRNNSPEKEQRFNATTAPKCGINITDGKGDLNFRDTHKSDPAKFTIHANSTDSVSIKFTTIGDNQELGRISYNIAKGSDLKDGEPMVVENNQKIQVYAQSNLDSRRVSAGKYSISTVVTVSCI